MVVESVKGSETKKSTNETMSKKHGNGEKGCITWTIFKNKNTSLHKQNQKFENSWNQDGHISYNSNQHFTECLWNVFELNVAMYGHE